MHFEERVYVMPGQTRGRAKTRRRYGFWKFMGDSVMVAFTGGLWLVWIFVREMRNR